MHSRHNYADIGKVFRAGRLPLGGLAALPGKPGCGFSGSSQAGSSVAEAVGDRTSNGR